MNPAAILTRSFETLGVRGAPTILRCISKTPLASQVSTARLAGGQIISFPAWDAYWARHLYAGVPYEPDVEAIFRRFARGRVLVDCGANIGYWSVRAKELGFIDAIAIEANEKLIPLLERNYGGRVVHAAVHSRSGEDMWFEGEGATGSLSSSGKPVRSVALADLNVGAPALVKLDVEGAEIAAIEGSRGLDAVFVYEDWPKSGMLVTKYLLESGYSVSGFDMTPIRTHADAFSFNARTNRHYGPSNFVAMHATASTRVGDLSP